MKMRKLLSILLVLALCASLLPMVVMANVTDDSPDDDVYPESNLPWCGNEGCGPGDCIHVGESSLGSVVPPLSPAELLLQTHTPAANGATAGGGNYILYNRVGGGKLIDSWAADGSKTSLTTDPFGRTLRLSYVSPGLEAQYNYANGAFTSGTAWGQEGRYAMDLEILGNGLRKATLRDMDGLEQPYTSLGMSFDALAGETSGLEHTEVENADGTITTIWTANGVEIFRTTVDKDGNLISETTTTEDKTVTTTENADGSTVTTTTYSNGDVEVKEKHADGSTTTTTTYSNGEVKTVEESTDGTVIITRTMPGPCRNTYTSYPNGVITSATEWPDGSIYTQVTDEVNETRSEIHEFPDGTTRVREFDKDGNLISDTTISDQAAEDLADAAQQEGADNVTIDVTPGEQGASNEQEPPAEGTVTNPDGSTTTTTIESDGTIVEETEYPNGDTKILKTETDGTVTSIHQRPDGTTEVIATWPDGGGIKEFTDTDGNTQSESFLAGAKPQHTLGIGSGTDHSGEQAPSFSSSSDGRTITTTDPDGTVTKTTPHDDGSVTVEVTKPDGTTIVTEFAPDGSMVEHIYGPDGTLITTNTISSGVNTSGDSGPGDSVSGDSGSGSDEPTNLITVTLPGFLLGDLAENGTGLSFNNNGSIVSFSPEELGNVTGVDGTVSFTMDASASGAMAIKATANGSLVEMPGVHTFHTGFGDAPIQLDNALNNLGAFKESLQAEASGRLDTDVAEEMMAYTKNNILIQSAQAMLAQANTLPQGVLQLLQ